MGFVQVYVKRGTRPRLAGGIGVLRLISAVQEPGRVGPVPVAVHAREHLFDMAVEEDHKGGVHVGTRGVMDAVLPFGVRLGGVVREALVLRVPALRIDAAVELVVTAPGRIGALGAPRLGVLAARVLREDLPEEEQLGGFGHVALPRGRAADVGRLARLPVLVGGGVEERIHRVRAEDALVLRRILVEVPAAFADELLHHRADVGVQVHHVLEQRAVLDAEAGVGPRPDVVGQLRRVGLVALVAGPGRVERHDPAVLGAPRHPPPAFGVDAARGVEMLVGLGVGDGAVVDRVGVDGGPQLREVVGAVLLLRGAERSEKVGRDHGGENADDRDDDEEFNKGEAPILLHCQSLVQGGRISRVPSLGKRALAPSAS